MSEDPLESGSSTAAIESGTRPATITVETGSRRSQPIKPVRIRTVPIGLSKVAFMAIDDPRDRPAPARRAGRNRAIPKLEFRLQAVCEPRSDRLKSVLQQEVGWARAWCRALTHS